MNRTRYLEIICQGEASRFVANAMDRKSLHGFRRRIALDAEGNECAVAHLTQDGRFLLAKGCTAGMYLDEAGDVIERKNLAADVAGTELGDPSPAHLRTQRRVEPATLDELLDHVVVAAHLLVPETLDPALDTALRRGDVYRLMYISEATAAPQPEFLLANASGIYLLEAQPCGFEPVRLTQPILDADALGMEEEADEFAFDWEATDESA